MDTRGRRRSTRVEDRRGQSGGGGFSFGGGGGCNPLLMLFALNMFKGRRGGNQSGGQAGGQRGCGCGGLVLVIIIIAVVLYFLFFRGAQSPSSNDYDDGGGRVNHEQQDDRRDPDRGDTVDENLGKKVGKYANADEEDIKDYLLVVLADLEDVWTQLFREAGKRYEPPTLVLFDGYTQSACGMGSSETGPFYCPADSKVYIDMSFFREMSRRFGADGDFAIAYVLAHEVGHHVQNQLGITAQTQRQQQSVSKAEANRISVRVELQADYFAGVYAHYMSEAGYLDVDDIEEAMNAAHAIGDDRLQEQSQGYSVPDSFTHGTSRQRAEWFERGYRSGTIEDGDTYSIPYDQLRWISDERMLAA